MPPPPKTPPPDPPRPEPPAWPIPEKLILEVQDLNHPGAALFFKHVDPPAAIRDAVLASYEWLYTMETVPRDVTQIRLVLRSMPGGVAHTFGSATHKEIHFSLEHLVNSQARARDEFHGVLTHEVVHCFQHNGRGTAPGGLIEGVADWVRLHAKLGPPHWKPGGDRWDAGYQCTAYFLEWLEERYGRGIVRQLNDALREHEYDANIFSDWTGSAVDELWQLYCADLEDSGKR